MGGSVGPEAIGREPRAAFQAVTVFSAAGGGAALSTRSAGDALRVCDPRRRDAVCIPGGRRPVGPRETQPKPPRWRGRESGGGCPEAWWGLGIRQKTVTRERLVWTAVFQAPGGEGLTLVRHSKNKSVGKTGLRKALEATSVSVRLGSRWTTPAVPHSAPALRTRAAGASRPTENSTGLRRGREARGSGAKQREGPWGRLDAGGGDQGAGRAGLGVWTWDVGLVPCSSGRWEAGGLFSPPRPCWVPHCRAQEPRGLGAGERG